MAAFLRASAHLGRIASCDPAEVLDVSDVGFLAISEIDRPLRSVFQNGVEIRTLHIQKTVATGAAWNVPEKLVQQGLELRPSLLLCPRRCQQTNAAVDIEADTAGRNDSLLKIGSRNAADTESIALVRIGHSQGTPSPTRQRGNIGYLIERLVFFDLGNQRLVGVNQTFNPHLFLEGLRDEITIP